MAKKIPLYFLKHYIFWLTFFAICRIPLIVYHWEKLNEAGLGDVFLTFYNAIYLDIAAIGYIMIFPFLIMAIQSFINRNFLNYVNLIYHLFIIIAVSAITAGELELYQYWQSKMNLKAIWHLFYGGDEARRSTTDYALILFYSVFIVQSTLGIIVYLKFFWKKISWGYRNWFVAMTFTIFTPLIVFVGMRGGLQEKPINHGSVFFSEADLLNKCATNSVWKLGHNLEQNILSEKENLYLTLAPNDAKSIVKNLFEVEKDTTVSILTTNRPNIVYLIMESWSADLINTLNKLDAEQGRLKNGQAPYIGITSGFQELEKEGILFSNCWGTGFSSDQGIVSILSSFPAQPVTSIIFNSDKSSQLPSICEELKIEDYSTSFMFGGDLSYGNIRSYLNHSSFDEIIEEKDFNPNEISAKNKGKLGIHDGYTLNQFRQHLNKQEQPFFSSWFSMSTHSPYDIPMQEKISWGGKEKEYLNSVFYSDSVLFEFLNKAKNEPWYDSTLFVIIADHSHTSPRNWNSTTSSYKKIPMLFYGNVIKEEFKGVVLDKYCDQTALSATILAQLGLPYENFRWSINLFNPTAKNFAFFSYRNGFGWVEKENRFSYDFDFNHFYEEDFNTATPEERELIIKRGRAYLQFLVQEYLEY